MTFSFLTEQASKQHPFPCPTTYRTALSYYVDITSSPRTNVLRELAEYATNPEHKDFLLRITSATEEGKVHCISYNRALRVRECVFVQRLPHLDCMLVI